MRLLVLRTFRNMRMRWQKDLRCLGRPRWVGHRARTGVLALDDVLSDVLSALLLDDDKVQVFRRIGEGPGWLIGDYGWLIGDYGWLIGDYGWLIGDHGLLIGHIEDDEPPAFIDTQIE